MHDHTSYKKFKVYIYHHNNYFSSLPLPLFSPPYLLINSTASWYFIPLSINATATKTGALRKKKHNHKAINTKSPLYCTLISRYHIQYMYISHSTYIQHVCTQAVPPQSSYTMHSYSTAWVHATLECTINQLHPLDDDVISGGTPIIKLEILWGEKGKPVKLF